MNLARFARNALMLALVVVFVALGVASLRTPHETVSPALPVHTPGVAAARSTPSMPPHPAAAPTVDCAAPGSLAAASANAQSLTTLAVSPSGVVETGWAAYAPLVGREIGTACGPDTVAFATSLATWQAAHGVTGAGRLDAATLSAMSVIWLERRPFVVASKKTCPPSPDEATLAQADKAEAYGGKTLKARSAALAAYRSMVQAARRDINIDQPFLIASAYRGPVEEAVRCALGGCGTPGKARCSAHRTGLAFDLYLGAAPGLNAFSTDPANRLYLSRTPGYRWLVAHADRYSFVNYPYEPWHWEWTGEPV